MSPSLGRTLSTVSLRTSDESVAVRNHRRVEDASRRPDTCNVVIFGQTGAGKSSLVNLITWTQASPTSPDTKGCTTESTVYEHDAVTQNKTLKVQLFDTVGLDEGPEGTVPNEQAQIALKKLLKTLEANRGIHLLMYCVLGSKDAQALERNYKLLCSKVKGGVPIVLVVTGLEGRKPEMEQWWTDNEKSISDLGMKFSGHACITAVTINESDTDEVRQRREQSYHAVCNLFEHCRPQNGTENFRGTTLPPARRTKNIVLFGETGAGKSSLVNLMAGKEVALTSSGTQHCTMRWQDYNIEFNGESFKVFNTFGLEEPQLGIKEYLESVENAYRLIKELDSQGGIDLLLFCIRAGRMTTTIQSNYRLFHEFLCEKKVPIVLAITNLEREQRMEDWWDREHDIFPRYQIYVAGHACITAANGLDSRHKDLYEESRITIRHLVKQSTADGQKQAWTGGDNLFASFMRKVKQLLTGGSHVKRKDLIPRLTKHCGISQEVAKHLADIIKQQKC
ncbi:P-loop containing nucleoside triphosphate hydrolase protein [Suillus clintonianus]|uniref:P-loop containing nucleoside triphosphate hydrolase protein n=1 Tax=Suillus clintonianus TaxID=1904413 RepID=UPI001B86CF19|nr:P-loop containing nucleoside triphosphate hydrolase protein [Suillus clintonianus]KAG2134459.1 P-loop containing nucleoside triphosphate hydrolase protein [Suillus clintonianus]